MIANILIPLVATGLFATQYNLWMVLTGVMTALTLLSIVAIYLGKFISNKVDKKVIAENSGIVFTIMGIIVGKTALFT